MNRLLVLVCALAGLAPARSEVLTQVLDDFATAAADGRPAGWEVVGLGAEASIRHVAADPGALSLEYRFTAPTGVVYLLRRARLRTAPERFELTANSHGGKLHLGLLIRDGIDEELYEYRSPLSLDDDNWATVEVPTVAANVVDGKVNGTIDALPGGGGTRLDGIVVRRAAGAPDEGRLEIGSLKVQCDVEPTQQAMVDSVGGRYDGLYCDGEAPAPELLVSSMEFGPATLEVEWSIVDQQERDCGSGRRQVQVRGERLARVPLEFRPAAPRGHFTVRAKASVGGSSRTCTDRFCVVPPPAASALVGSAIESQPGELQPWVDVLVARALRRAGAGFIAIEAGAPEMAHWVDLARRNDLGVVASLPVPGYDPTRPGQTVAAEAVLAQIATVRQACGDRLLAVTLWPRGNEAVGWPPVPRPVAYRELLERVAAALGPDGPPLVACGLAAFDAPFMATVLLREPYPLGYLGLWAPTPRLALPLPEGEQPPSARLQATLAGLRAWCKTNGRPVLPPWCGPLGVRTSPVEESKNAQAAELARLAALTAGAGGGFAWSSARDGDEDNRFGLLRRDLQPKESLAAFAVAAASYDGAKCLGHAALPEGLDGSVLTAGGGFLAVVFGQGNLSLQGETAARDMWGNPMTAPRASSEPIYLTGAGVADSIPVAR